MERFLSGQDVGLSNWAYYGPLIAVIVWEAVAARREAPHPTWLRWIGNAGFGVANLWVRQLALAVFSVLVATEAERAGFGLFHLVTLPAIAALPVALIALDLVAYWKHRMYHAAAWPWRLHLVHHSDLECDFSTSLRHHPLEGFVDTLLTAATVALLGVPPAAVAAYAAVSGAVDIFSHANVRLPEAADLRLRRLIVTPDYHVVHHSSAKRETDSNFAIVLSCWDRLFGTYRAAPRGGVEAMVVGLEYFRDPKELWPHRMLIQPFRRPAFQRRSPAPA
jgi:sterol desaturase/sphingolipid hydroxylase (fatty acid hydroxylase superfamily)